MVHALNSVESKWTNEEARKWASKRSEQVSIIIRALIHAYGP